ncbi:MAG: MFS transporter [Kiritimatiellia bacterium]|jgi:DHA1 family multidrug resistance protein-like MFS transporter
MTRWKKTFTYAFLAQVLSSVGFSFAIPFLPFFIQELGIVDKAQQAWWSGVLMAATGLTLALFAPLWGWLADRFGHKSMVMRSMFGGAIIVFLMSYSRNVYELLAFRLLQGMFTGTVSASISLVASVTPPRRSGFALGMMQAAVFVGSATGPLLGGIMADYYGYRMSFQGGAAIILLGGLLVLFGATEAEPKEEEVSEEPPIEFKVLLKSGVFVFAILTLFAVRFANTMINPSFPLIIQEIIKTTSRLNSVAGGIMASAGLAGAVTAGLLGYLGDKFGHHQVLIVCSLGVAVTATAHAVAHTIPFLTVVHLFFGMTIAGILPSINSIIQRSTDQRHLGKAYGVSTSISMLGLAVGPLAGGYLASRCGVRVPFLAAGFCHVMVTIIAFRWLARLRKIIGSESKAT